jgi:5-methylcytosine-specific restriction endonuclease McrA
MKVCPKCDTPHDNKGIFCCRSCANSRNFSPDAIKKKAESNKKFWSSLSLEQRKDIQQERSKKYDFEEQQRRAQETKILKSWNRPHEEMGHGAVRRRLLAESGYTCNECNLGPVWQGKPLALELDHIDGNRTNNRRENLRILCPNCHAQTPTYRAKNIKLKKLKSI